MSVPQRCTCTAAYEFGHSPKPLEACLEGLPRIEEEAGNFVCWRLRNSDVITSCRILADLLSELSGESDSVAMDLFVGNRSAIEDAARERYGTPVPSAGR